MRYLVVMKVISLPKLPELRCCISSPCRPTVSRKCKIVREVDNLGQAGLGRLPAGNDQVVHRR